MMQKSITDLVVKGLIGIKKDSKKFNERKLIIIINNLIAR